MTHRTTGCSALFALAFPHHRLIPAETRDPKSCSESFSVQGHVDRVRRGALKIAALECLADAGGDVLVVELAALMHDVLSAPTSKPQTPTPGTLNPELSARLLHSPHRMAPTHTGSNQLER